MRGLQTDRLLLCKVAPEDGHWLWELDADPVVMRFINGGLPRRREDFEHESLPRMLQTFAAGPQFGIWVAALRSSGFPIGWFHLRPERQAPFEMELGYRLRAEAWGQGLATEGSLELLRRAFRDWGVPRVVAHALTGNQASRRVMEKCGLRWERDFIAPESWLPGWSEEERRSVRYRIEAGEFAR